MTLLDRSMTDSAEVIRMIAGEWVEGERRPEPVRDGPWPCRLILDAPGAADPRTGRQVIRGRAYIVPDAAPQAGDAVAISSVALGDAEWLVASVTRLVRQGRELALEAAVTRIVDR